jgi:hypothetical protein
MPAAVTLTRDDARRAIADVDRREALAAARRVAQDPEDVLLAAAVSLLAARTRVAKLDALEAIAETARADRLAAMDAEQEAAWVDRAARRALGAARLAAT